MNGNYSNQRGYFLILAVILIVVVGTLGTVMVFSFVNRAQLSAAQLQGLNAFYIAESGLQCASRLLTMPAITGTPSRIAYNALTGNAAVTNAAMNGGAFTATATFGYSLGSLTSAIGATDTTIPVSAFYSSVGPTGRIKIDRELIDYAGMSGSSFVGVTRGVGGSLASSHVSGAGYSQYQVTLDVNAGIPNLSSPSYQRELKSVVQLQNGWAAGNANNGNFTFLNWGISAQNAWTDNSVANATYNTNINGIDLLSIFDVWGVGNSIGTNFIFYQVTGGTNGVLAKSGACSGQNLLGISMVSGKEGWAVGTVYVPLLCIGTGTRYTILKWNGTNWTLLTPTTTPSIPADTTANKTLNAVSVIDNSGNGTGDIGFAVGNSGKILQYNGTNWVAAVSNTTKTLSGVSTVSASEAWAVGASGAIMRWNGSTWSSFTSPTTTALNAIAMLDTDGDGLANVGWAVGNAGTLLTYNGSTWSATTVGTINLFAVDFVNANDAWAVGGSGVIIHYDGTGWTKITSPTSVALNAIALAKQLSPVSQWQEVFH